MRARRRGRQDRGRRRRGREAARPRPDVPIVALGGAGEALAPRVAGRLGRPLLRPEHPEVLSSIGAALSLVRAEVVRTSTTGSASPSSPREAERACIEAGAAPPTVTVETTFDAQDRVLRAVATGAVALESGAATASRWTTGAQLAAAARRSEPPADALSARGRDDFYRVFSENGRGRVAVVDARRGPGRRNARGGSREGRRIPRAFARSCKTTPATSASPRLSRAVLVGVARPRPLGRTPHRRHPRRRGAAIDGDGPAVASSRADVALPQPGGPLERLARGGRGSWGRSSSPASRSGSRSPPSNRRRALVRGRRPGEVQGDAATVARRARAAHDRVPRRAPRRHRSTRARPRPARADAAGAVRGGARQTLLLLDPDGTARGRRRR